ncbi:hypothetical protein KBZ94_20960 [Streptomyces sp. RM72]|jgi:hypothetical protein|uniref:hypothetical protein n=1 Tax=unclassified Streptomyces TaxID=2593676 RepID=UPI000FAB8847|nr:MULTISPECIES: hypothetical protein [unclassified Streptomyces]MBQ0887379.1 hypothetical protein [Streptomyces sp. RM72]
MELSGWVAAGVMGVVVGSTLVGRIFDQIPTLTQKMITAIRAVRAVREELRSGRD